jgi:hypothetical protein
MSILYLKRVSYVNGLVPKTYKETGVFKRKAILKHLIAPAVDPRSPVSSKALQ